jgi:hypothetical protein
MIDKFKIKRGTNKICIRGDRNAPFIRAYLDLPKELRQELDKVLDVTLFDGYTLSIFEWED